MKNDKHFFKKFKEANFELFYKLYSNYTPSKYKSLLLELIDFIQYCALFNNYKVKYKINNNLNQTYNYYGSTNLYKKIVKTFQNINPLSYTYNNLTLYCILLCITYIISLSAFSIYINLITVCIQKKELEKRQYQMYLLRIIFEFFPVLIIPIIGKNNILIFFYFRIKQFLYYL